MDDSLSLVASVSEPQKDDMDIQSDLLPPPPKGEAPTDTPVIIKNLKTKEQIEEIWQLYVDSSASLGSGGVGLLLVNPGGAKMEYAIKLDFPVTNNEAEYEALLSGLKLAKSVMATKVRAHTDSQLVESQFSGEFTTKGPALIKYLEQLKKTAQSFTEFSLSRIPRTMNERADVLSKLASASGSIDTHSVVLMTSKRPSISIDPSPTKVMVIGEVDDWRTDVVKYLVDYILPSDKADA